MSREGRALPIQPVVIHGPVVQTAVVPPPPIVVVLADPRQRHRLYPQIDPIVERGFLGNIPANGVTPPYTILNVDRDDQRVRRTPLDPFTFDSVLAGLTLPFVPPPEPQVVLPEDSRRLFAATPWISHGYDEVAPPRPNVVEPLPAPATRRRNLESILLGGIRAFVSLFVPPPEAQSIEPEPRWRRLIPSIPTIIRGTIAPTIVLNPPVNVVLPVVSGPVYAGSQLSADTGTWLFSPTSYAYQWQKSLGGDWADIPGATSSTYTATSGDVNWTLRVKVTATNADGNGVAFSPPTDHIGVSYNRVIFYN